VGLYKELILLKWSQRDNKDPEKLPPISMRFATRRMSYLPSKDVQSYLTDEDKRELIRIINADGVEAAYKWLIATLQIRAGNPVSVTDLPNGSENYYRCFLLIRHHEVDQWQSIIV